MSNPYDDQELQRYLDGRSEVSRTYARLPQDEPGATVDQRILAAARREAARPRRPAWMVPTALAATLMLALSLSWQQLRGPTSRISDTVTLEPAAPPAAPADRAGFAENEMDDVASRRSNAKERVGLDRTTQRQLAAPDPAAAPAGSNRARLDAALEAAVAAPSNETPIDTTPASAEQMRVPAAPAAATRRAAPAHEQAAAEQLGGMATPAKQHAGGGDEEAGRTRLAHAPGVDPGADSPALPDDANQSGRVPRSDAADSAAPRSASRETEARDWTPSPRTDADRPVDDATARVARESVAAARGAHASGSANAAAPEAGTKDAQRRATRSDDVPARRGGELAHTGDQVEPAVAAPSLSGSSATAEAAHDAVNESLSPAPDTTAVAAAKARQPDLLAGYRRGEPQAAVSEGTAPVLPESTRASPQKFLAAIRARHDQGAADDARALLGEFRERYPHYPLPDDFPLAEPLPAEPGAGSPQPAQPRSQ